LSMLRSCASPTQFGYVLDTIWKVTVFFSSLTVYQPNTEMLRRMISAYSSGVPVSRLLLAIFGTSLAT